MSTTKVLSLWLEISVVHEPARGTPGLKGSSLSGTWTRGLEPGLGRQESAKNAPRGSSLESSRLMDPCLSRLKPPRDSSPLVDPCSSRQEATWQETQVRSSRVQTGLEAPPGSKDSSPLGSCTTLLEMQNFMPRRSILISNITSCENMSRKRLSHSFTAPPPT